MRRGMAVEIQNNQIAMRNGQMSLFDVMGTEDLLETRSCIFDRVNQLIYDDDTWIDEEQKYDLEVA